MSKSRRRGIFALIRSREDAIATVNGTVLVFFLIVIVLAGLWLARGEPTLLTMGLFGVLSALIWRFKSPAAAFALLLSSVMLLLFTLAKTADTEEIDWRYAAISSVAIFASIRATEATLKLVGRFAKERG